MAISYKAKLSKKRTTLSIKDITSRSAIKRDISGIVDTPCFLALALRLESGPNR
jgi:hypothetical protein